MGIAELINTVYEKVAYHVTYSINEHGAIVKEEHNVRYSVARFNRTLTVVLSIMLFIFVFGLTTNELTRRSQNKIYLETFYIDQLCFRDEHLSECYNIQSRNGIHIYQHVEDDISTLFISGE